MQHKLNIEEQEIKDEKVRANIKSRRELPIREELVKLMLAVTAHRTRVHFHERHFCVEHKRKVNKEHIDSCELLPTGLNPTAFNELLIEKSVHDIDRETKIELINHFERLNKRIQTLLT